MKVHLDCFPCFLRQSLIALRLGTDDEALQEAVLKSTLEYIRATDTSQPPAYTIYLRIIKTSSDLANLYTASLPDE